MKPAVFRVFVRQESNGLNGMVELISFTNSSAKRFALKQFFRGNWQVTKVEKVREI